VIGLERSRPSTLDAAIMTFDRKLLLIAPTIVLAFIVAGMAYATTQLRVLNSGEDTWKERSNFVAAVERKEKSLTPAQATTLLKLSLDVEARRAAGIRAAHDLLFALAIMTAICVLVLVFAIRRIPREHWPRFNFGGASRESSSSASSTPGTPS